MKRTRLIDKLHGEDLLGWRYVGGGEMLPTVAGETVFRCDDFEGLRDAACRSLDIARLDVSGLHRRP